MTRARDTLILTGAVTEKKWETLWTKPEAITPRAIVAAKSYADWLGLWFASPAVRSPQSKAMTGGELPHLRWRIVEKRNLAMIQPAGAEVTRPN